MMTKRYPICILATAVVPWTEDYQIDEDRFRREIRFLSEQVSRNIYLFGTAGEGHAVSEAQFRRLVTIFGEECTALKAEPMIGLISLSLPQIQERIRFCRDRGIHDFQLAFPSWGTLVEAEWKAFFAETCGLFPDCRFLHYNNKRSGIRLEPTDYGVLAEEHTNLVAVKHTQDTPERMQQFVQSAPALTFFPSELLYSEVRDTCEVGLLPSLSLVYPERLRQLFHARGDALREAARDLPALRAAVIGHVGRSGAHMDSAYDKALYKVNDPEFPLRLLPPYLGCSEADFRGFLADLPESWRQGG